MKVRAFILLTTLLAGCAMRGGTTPGELAPTSRSEWPALLSQASQEASAGRYSVADKLLSDFTVKYPASGEGAESMYWRAIYKLDAANPSASPREATVLLDSYLTNTTVVHRTEASTLRRLVAAVETRAAVGVPARPATDAVAPVNDKAKDDEIARLKDELARANAELERIKRRLAQPTKP